MVSQIAFRTHADSQIGIGHMYRCCVLSKKLAEEGVKSLFFVDQASDELTSFFSEIHIESLYDSDELFCDEEDDFRRFDGIARDFSIEWVVIDDYRIGKAWERSAHKSYRLCVFDDMLRPHQCDILVDSRWRGEIPNDYDHLTDSNTVRLIGPRYALIAGNSSSHNKKSEAVFQIVISLGGGGSAHELLRIVEPFLNHCLDGCQIKLICGPMMRDTEIFSECNIDKNKSVEIVCGKNDISDIISASSLYVGAAGGVMYQCLFYKVPMITFSTSKDQYNSRERLEELGHYFHLDFDDVDFCELAELAFCMRRNLDRITRLTEHKIVEIDALGANRIRDKILGKSVPENAIRNKSSVPNWERISDHYRVRAVLDSDLNSYLDARNKIDNRKNMRIEDPIPRTEHYLWWFQNNRSKFVFESNGVENIYLWHELIEVEKRQFLIGGWFVKSEVTPFDVISMIDWQLKICREQNPGIPWIAIIKRGNQFVRTLNDYFQFLEIDESDWRYSAVQAAFNVSSNEDFHFLVLENPVQDGVE